MRIKSDGIHIPAIAPCFIVALALFHLFCVVSSDPPNETFRFVHADQIDTIAPWGELSAVFSEQLAESAAVGFVFNPSFYSFVIIMNGVHDTALLQCTEPLQGNSRYVLRLKESVVSRSAAVFNPLNDSIVFFTYPAEQEPNGTRPTADTLRGRCFGAIATVDDTDWYVIADESAYAVYLNSEGSQTTFFLGNAVDSTKGQRTFVPGDTLAIPDGWRPPVFVAVSSYYRSVGGYYEVGFIAE